MTRLHKLMIESMTGYGKGSATRDGITFTVELRSINNRFFEISSRIPRSLSQRENEIRELVRAKIARGKVTVNANKEDESDNELTITVNKDRTKAIHFLLNQLRKSAKIKEPVKLEHLLHFSEVFESKETEENETEWKIFAQALTKAIDELKTMRMKEGAELARDMMGRVTSINSTLDSIEQLAKLRVPDERKKLQERIAAMLEDKSIIDNQRLELEIALLSDKLDVTEECVRFRSHNKFFLEALQSKASEGRKLNFLIQEMNREANTIGSKCNDVQIAHLVVGIKEELEKVREQLQNIE